MKKSKKILGASLVVSLFLMGMGSTSACDYTTELIADGGDSDPVGTLNIYHAADSSTMIITFQTYDGWLFTKTHLEIASDFDDIPYVNQGSPEKPNCPKVGQFVNSTGPGVPPTDTHVYIIDLSEYLEANSQGKYKGTIYISARAVVKSTTGLTGEVTWANDLADQYDDPWYGEGNRALYLELEF